MSGWDRPSWSALELERLEDDGGPVERQTTIRWTDADARYDGEWWPQSDDAAAELSALLPEVRKHTHHAVTRVTLGMSEWAGEHPRRLTIGGRTLRIGWFPHLPEHTVTVGWGADPRLVLRTHQAPATTGLPR